jgi:hypothetical protein
MAYLKIFATSTALSVSASSTLNLLQVKAPSNQVVLIRGIRFAGNSAAGGVDVPVKYRLTRSTANFGSSSSNSAVTGKQDPGRAETIQSTITGNLTTPPTSPTDTGDLWYVSPQTCYEIIFPADQPIIIPGGASVQIEATTGSTAASPEVTFLVEE